MSDREGYAIKERFGAPPAGDPLSEGKSNGLPGFPMDRSRGVLLNRRALSPAAGQSKMLSSGFAQKHADSVQLQNLPNVGGIPCKIGSQWDACGPLPHAQGMEPIKSYKAQ